jgi:RimJ/RimL family protein N-acetyltransferase
MIKGEKITLRTVKEADLAAYYALLADVQNKGEYYPQHFQSYTDFLKGYHNRGFWHEGRGALLIVDAQDTILGEMTFRELSHRHALDIGYIVFDPGNRNQGIATEALTLFTDYLFATRHVQRLELAVIVGNEASKKVAQKCGFTFEGISRKAFYVRGHYVDLENYALVRE